MSSIHEKGTLVKKFLPERINDCTGDEEWKIFPNFELLPCFNIDVQPELVNNNFNDEKESLISRRRNANDNSSNQKNEIWPECMGCRRQGKMTSTDLRRQQMLQHELSSIYFSKKSWLQTFTRPNARPNAVSSMYVRARPKMAGKWGDERAQLQPITVTNERTGFLPVWKQRNEFRQIKQNRAIFVRMKKNKDFIKVRRKQSYNKHLIRRLTSRSGWVFLLVELYFGSLKYCRLVKILPSHIGWSTV